MECPAAGGPPPDLKLAAPKVDLASQAMECAAAGGLPLDLKLAGLKVDLASQAMEVTTRVYLTGPGNRTAGRR
jgi:hypothetical protein